jgi:EmrB/QacA subfamily drug resistance transporter
LTEGNLSDTSYFPLDLANERDQAAFFRMAQNNDQARAAASGHASTASGTSSSSEAGAAAGPQSDTAAKTLFATERNPRLRFLIPLVVAFAFLMEEVDSTVITTAIPQMARDLDTTVLRLSLAITSYMLTLAVFIPVSGWFADRFGARRIFTLALLIFTASSILCGLSGNLGELVAARCIQGFGGAMMAPVGRLILLRSFPRAQFLRAMLYMSLPAMVGPVIGPLLGGALTTYLSWRWIFYVNLPFGIVGILLAYKFIEETRAEAPTKFDFRGFIIAGAGLSLLQFGLENISHPIVTPTTTAIMLVLGTLLMIGFAFHALSHKAPAIDPSLFKVRAFRIGTLVGGICRIGINGVPFLLPLMLQVGLGMTPIQSGSLTFITTLGTLIIRPLSQRILRLMGFDRMLVASAILNVLVIAGFALIVPGTPHWLIGAYVALFGFARSSQFLSSNTLSYSEIPAEKLSRATSLGGVLQNLAISFGVAISAMILGLVRGQDGSLTLADFHQVFLLMAVIPLISIPGFLFLRPEDGAAVSGHHRRARRAPSGE